MANSFRSAMSFRLMSRAAACRGVDRSRNRRARIPTRRQITSTTGDKMDDSMGLQSLCSAIRRATVGLRRSAKTTAAMVLLAAGAGSAHAAPQGPCDLYAAGGTPCVAAHSTTRVLLSTYAGPLYQVRR